MFESTWTTKGVNYIRQKTPSQRGSQKLKTHFKPEYFVPDVMGKYKGFLDQVPLKKVIGRPQKGSYGIKQADYVSIRELFENNYNKDPRIWHLDIETSVGTNSTGFPHPDEALEPIVLIQFFDTTENKGYLLGLEEWYYRDDYDYDFELEYIQCKDEKTLLSEFLELFKTLDPLVITAWNGNNFDYPYLYNRLNKYNLENKLSNYGQVDLKIRKLDNGTILNSLKSQGHFFIDLMDVYKKFVFKNVSSYSLDNIGLVETNQKKVDHLNYIKFDDFRTGVYTILGDETTEQKEKKIHRCALALQNPEMKEEKAEKLKRYIKEKSYSEFVHYGVQDFVILKGINDAQNLIPIMIQISEKMGCTLDDTLGTLKPWNSYISNIAYKKGLIMPPKKDHDDPDIVGGFVREPRVGKHSWVLSADVDSMYPLLGIAAGNMSPETFIPKEERPKELQQMLDKYFYTQDENKYLPYYEEWDTITGILKKYDVSLGIDGSVYKKDKTGLIPELVTDIYDSRKLKKKQMFVHEQRKVALEEKMKTNKDLKQEYKKEKHLEDLMNTAQMTEKILINSLYGALGNVHFSLYNESIARSITGNGRYFIQYVANKVEIELQKMIPYDKPYLLAGDTDSVVGSTMISTSQGKLKIEDLYNSMNGTVEIQSTDNFVKHISDDITTVSFNTKTEKPEQKQIKYIMKHKVKKRMYQIHDNISGESVIVTEDHSVIVKRGNEYLSIKPKDIHESDLIIIKKQTSYSISSNYTITDLGVQENWVYDIEVQDNHNFFGNNILVHNSFYFTIDPFIQKYKKDYDVMEQTEWADKFYDKIVAKIVQKSTDKYAMRLNLYNPSKINTEREVISDCLVGSTKIRVKENNKTRLTTLHSFVNKYTTDKNIIDISDKNIEILSLNKVGGIELKKILNVQKKRTTKKMVTLSNGKFTLKCTEDHLIAVKKDNKIIYKKAINITSKDDVQIYDKFTYSKDAYDDYEIEYFNANSTTFKQSQGKSKKDILKVRKEMGISISKSLNKKTKEAKSAVKNRVYKIFKKYGYLKPILIYNQVNTKDISFEKIFQSLKSIDIDVPIHIEYFKKYRYRKVCIICGKKYSKFTLNTIKKTGTRQTCSKTCEHTFRSSQGITKTSGYIKFERRVEVVLRKIRRKNNIYNFRKYKFSIIRKSYKNAIKNRLENIEKSSRTGYHLDHIYPITLGYKNDISIVKMSNITNLQMLPAKDNLSKSGKLPDIIPDIILEELKDKK